jgi:hypothetical protein
MTSDRGSSQATQPLIGMSLQSLFLLHHLNALEKLQAIITMSDLGESGRSIAMAMQVSYLLHLLPRDRQQEILLEVKGYEQELRKIDKNMSDLMISYNRTFRIVTSVIEYLTANLDIIREDVIGPIGDRVLQALAEPEGKDTDLVVAEI